jgi:hypothetical protein
MKKWITAVICLSVTGFVLCGEEVVKPPAPAGPPSEPPSKLPVPRAKVLDKAELLPFLPPPPKGWTAGKPTGRTLRASFFASTQVSRVYRKGGQEITFLLEDLGSNNPYFYMKEVWKPSEKKEEDWYSKKLMLGEIAAEQSYNKKAKRGLIFLVLDKRIQLNVAGLKMEEEDTSVLVELAKTIDFKKLKKAMEEKSK